MDDLLAEFVAETREMLAALSGEIVAWEADPTERARLDTIFRFVHTVKGNCGFFDFPRLEALSHAAEDALSDARAGRRVPDRRLVDTVLAVIDRIGAMIEEIERGEPLSEADDERLIAALRGELDDADLPLANSGGARSSFSAADQRTIRLPVELIDQVMSGVSEMVLARNDIARRLQMRGVETGIEAPFSRLSALITEVRDAITRTRMRRIEGLFATFPRLVRDLSAELGKQVFVEIENGEVELDREMIELIRDPLLHIIRNAVDHGIESPGERRAAGKREAGMLTVSARQTGNTIHIGIMDDGRGIDCDRLSQKAIAAGIITAERAAEMTRAEKIELMFEPGLSTANHVTAISGRGVGMDVVQSRIRELSGAVQIHSEPGAGSRFAIRVPLTLAILPTLLVEVAGDVYALPLVRVVEVLSHAPGRELWIDGQRVLDLRQQPLPLLGLREWLGMDPLPLPDSTCVVLQSGEQRYCLAVDQVRGREEVVIKALPPTLRGLPGYAGASLIGDGRMALILDVDALQGGSARVPGPRSSNPPPDR